MTCIHNKDEKSIDSPPSRSQNSSTPEQKPEKVVEKDEAGSLGPRYPGSGTKIGQFMQGESISSPLTGVSISQILNRKPKIDSEMLQAFLKKHAKLLDSSSKEN